MVYAIVADHVWRKGGNMARSATTETKKKTRRGNGEGSIYQKPDGTWVAQALLGYRSDGKPVRKSFTGKTRREVASKLSAATTQVFQGSILTQPDKSVFEEFARYWLSVKRIEVTSRTLNWNNTMLSTYILPLIGGIPLCEVSVVHMQSIINRMAAKSLSHRTIKGVRDVLGQMMKFACRQRLVSSNPVECVVIPKPQRKAGEDTTSKAIPIALRTEVLQAAQTEPLMKPIIITLMLTGLRPSEALALSWENVDMSRRILTINQALTVAYDYDRFGNTSNKPRSLGRPKQTPAIGELPYHRPSSTLSPSGSFMCLRCQKRNRCSTPKTPSLSAPPQAATAPIKASAPATVIFCGGIIWMPST